MRGGVLVAAAPPCSWLLRELPLLPLPPLRADVVIWLAMALRLLPLPPFCLPLALVPPLALALPLPLVSPLRCGESAVAAAAPLLVSPPLSVPLELRLLRTSKEPSPEPSDELLLPKLGELELASVFRPTEEPLSGLSVSEVPYEALVELIHDSGSLGVSTDAAFNARSTSSVMLTWSRVHVASIQVARSSRLGCDTTAHTLS